MPSVIGLIVSAEFDPTRNLFAKITRTNIAIASPIVVLVRRSVARRVPKTFVIEPPMVPMPEIISPFPGCIKTITIINIAIMSNIIVMKVSIVLKNLYCELYRIQI